MSTASRAQTIVSLAADADALIEDLRPILENIAINEAALYSEAIQEGKPVTDCIAGRRRLAHYALGRCFAPEFSQTVEELATAAWAGYLA
ncbi:MAG: hypothetical protein GC182_14860 [Rhodopseudomonas sp.]|nr:hypothetical protein [Rhodopseudomonas sp.]